MGFRPYSFAMKWKFSVNLINKSFIKWLWGDGRKMAPGNEQKDQKMLL